MYPKKTSCFEWDEALVELTIFFPSCRIQVYRYFLRGLTCWPVSLLKRINWRNSSMNLRTEGTMHTTEVKTLLISVNTVRQRSKYVMILWTCCELYEQFWQIFDQHEVLKCRHQVFHLEQAQSTHGFSKYSWKYCQELLRLIGVFSGQQLHGWVWLHSSALIISS